MFPIPQIGHLVWSNFNRFFPKDWVGGERVQQRSLAHGDNELPKTKETWGVANWETGRLGSNFLDVKSGLDLVDCFLGAFSGESPEEPSLARRIFGSLGSFFGGMRDKVMYERLYGMGVGEELTDEQILDQRRTLEKAPYEDDYLENLRQSKMYGETGVAALMKWATYAASIKPLLQLGTGLIFGEQARQSVEALADKPAQVAWRARFFGSSLHGNFFTSWLNLLWLGPASLFSGKAKEKLSGIVSDLGKNSKSYFENKGEKDKCEGKSDFGTYLSMLADRVKEHWRAFRNPEAEIEEKKKAGMIKEGEMSVHGQRWSALSELVAPFCGFFGIVSAAIFDPLRIVLNLAGVEKGKNLLGFLATSRKTFQTLAYIPRFIIPEYLEGEKYKQLEEEVKNGTATEATVQLYQARKHRYINSIVGAIGMTGSALEPIGHLFGLGSSENSFTKFAFNFGTRISDNLFMRFFTARRQCQGIIGYIKSLALQRSKDDTQKLDVTYDEMQKQAINTRENTPVMKGDFLTTAVMWLSNMVNGIKSNFNDVIALSPGETIEQPEKSQKVGILA